MSNNLSRRGLLVASAAVAGGLAAGRPAFAAGARITLPPPTGPYPVGVVDLHLIDRSQPDPVAGPGRFRELMASVWYPARDVLRRPRAPWMAAAPFARMLADNDIPPDLVPPPTTWGHLGAPVRETGAPLPVVVYSHEAHDHRSDATIIVQELASHGYAVVTVDHTYDAYTEFPDGRVLVPDDSIPLNPRDFAADIRYLLDVVEGLAAGRNPDAGGRALPLGLAGALDPRRIGALGYSKGATAIALVTGSDRRIRAGLAIDGPMESNPAPDADIDRPFMLMTAVFTRATSDYVADFWGHLTRWRLNVQACRAGHDSYGDLEWLFPQVERLGAVDAPVVRNAIGDLVPRRGVRIQQAYPKAFFDLHLRHRGGHLLDGPSRDFPEVTFLP